MKVLDLLKKAGIIAVEGEERDAPRVTSDDDAARTASKSGKEKGGSPHATSPESQAAIKMPEPPSAEAMAPLAARELTIDFAQIYAALKIPTPAHGWNVEKVSAAIASPHFKTLDAATKKAALLAMLGASNAEPKDIVEDAARRDQALDAYEGFARKKLADRVAGVRQAIAEEEERIRLATQAIERHKQAMGEEEQGFSHWLTKKVEQEEELVRVVSLLTDQSVISVGGVDAQKTPSPGAQPPAEEPEGKRKKT